ncbi:two-component system, NarL family, sensor histidine kinase DesK [Micromonospora coriariae]|uniref:Two-component system, NarL family, sensor histidine kinase DesK n=1 Tax=Micromonospora coriariae TaxID=285665 RepID=A0A1C4X0E9_9ACTN|nr:two-component system, NarL family, sensor histidine kinase DesK [Micromonospora coriariae]
MHNALIVAVVLAGVAFDPLHPVPSLPFALVLGLQLLHCLTPWRNRWTLAAQVVLLPWAGPGAAGMVAASTLLMTRGVVRWILFVTVTVMAAVISPATPFEIALAMFNAAAQGLILFGVTRLGDTRAAVSATRAELAARSVEAERTRAAGQLETAVGTALSSIITLAVRADTARIAEVSRSAAASARAVPLNSARPLPEPDLPPRLAVPILVAVHAGFFVTGLIYVEGRPAPSILFAGILGLHLLHALPRQSEPTPRRRPWIALALLPASAAALLYPGQGYPQAAGFAAAAFLIAGRAWWPVVAMVVLATPAVLAVRGYSASENAYWTFNTIAVAAMFAGLAVQTALVLEAREARQALAAIAVADERRRISRDVHDLLGYGLSAITVKAELADRLTPEAAREQLGEIAGVARQSLAALRAIPDDPDIRLSLTAELDSARSLLESAGIRTDLRRTSERDDALLAIVLREGVTNVLRHSAATYCLIEITPDGLVIVNDGALAARGSGSGTANLIARVTAAGGTLSIGGEPGVYRLAVLYPALFDRDPDRVEPVTRG